MFVKPLFKTVILSSLIFGLIVILGMKYHWVDYLKGADKKNIELALPQHSVPDVMSQEDVPEKEDFQLEIIRSDKQSIIANMTKEQVKEGCKQLYKKMGLQNNEMIDVVVGDCVVSNYQEAIQDTRQLTARQKQRQLIIKSACHKKSNVQTHLDAIEKQFFFGVCVSDGINQLD